MRITFCLLSIIFLFTQCGVEQRTIYYWNQWRGPSTKIPEKKEKIASLKIINYPDSVFPSGEILKLINLSSIEIIGGKALQIRPETAEFNKLSKIIFNACSFKRFPFDICQLSSLKELGFVFCDLRKLPDSLGVFRNLKTLDLTGNHLTSLPQSVSKLENLDTLLLQNNDLTNIPPELLTIPKIAYINLSNSEGEDLTTQNKIDYIYEIELLKSLLKKESVKKVLIHVENKAEIQKIVDELDDTELQKKLSFHYFIHGFFNSD